jgi:hypothetical protein
MKINQLISHFGTPDKAAKGLNVSVQAVYQWMQADQIPVLRQSDIEVRTGYELKSEFTLQRLAKEMKQLREGDHVTG